MPIQLHTNVDDSLWIERFNGNLQNCPQSDTRKFLHTTSSWMGKKEAKKWIFSNDPNNTVV